MSRPQRIVKPVNLKEISFSEEEMEDAVGNISPPAVVEDPAATLIVTQNAKEFDLNHFKQFKKRVECCNRNTMRIHNKNTKSKDHGSADRGLVYIEFNAGMFEAIKKNMMRILRDTYKVIMTKAKIEFYGEAEERINIDFQVSLNGHVHEMKMKVYNTVCALDVQALGIPTETTFAHLSNITCGLFFAENVIVRVVNILDKHIDIKKLNEYHRKLAIDGKNATKNKLSKSCSSCEKDVKTGNAIKCHTCKLLTHRECVSKSMTEQCLERQLAKNKFSCEKCYISPVYNEDIEDDGAVLTRLAIMNESTESNLEVEEISSDEYICNMCKFKGMDGAKLREHIVAVHGDNSNTLSSVCEICSMTFITQNELMAHVQNVHNLSCPDCWKSFKDSHQLSIHVNQCMNDRKRKRMEASLLLDDSCDKCDKTTEANTTLKEHLSQKHGENEKLQKDLIELQSRFDVINEELKKAKDEISEVDKEVKNVIQENKTLKLDKEKMELENLSLKNDLKVLEKEVNTNDIDGVIADKNDEIERGKLIIQEKEKTLKKVKEAHKKEVQEIQRERIAAQEDLNSLKKENKTIKDKEGTLLEIFGMLKKFVKIDEEITNEATIPTKNDEASSLLNCKSCNHTSTDIEALNKHTRDEHIITKYPCIECDYQALSMDSLRKHQKEIHGQNGARSKTKVGCGKCAFTTVSENNLEVHKSKEHEVVFKCKLCEDEFSTESELLLHEELDHRRSRFTCNECEKIFPSNSRLQNHKQHVHAVSTHCVCDYCGFKCDTLKDLDLHIENTHAAFKNKRKDIDMRDLSHRKPCDPSSPTHSRSCCDRTPREHLKNEICHFQEYCRYGRKKCKFIHFENQEQVSSFLGSRNHQEFINHSRR